MATNDFVPFATGTGANVYSTPTYQASNARLLGVVDGEADPKLANNSWRQASVIASMIGGFIASQNFDALDDGNISNLLANFAAALNKSTGAQFPSRQRIHFGSDTGIANRIVADVSPDIGGYETGAIYWILAANAPTGASVANLDGRGDRNIVRRDGSAVQSGDWSPGEIIELRDDGTRLQLASSGGVSGLQYSGADTSGSAQTVSAAVRPAITQYTAYASYSITTVNDAVDGGTQANFGPGLRDVVRPDGSAIRKGDWLKGQVVLFIDDGARLQAITVPGLSQVTTTLNTLSVTGGRTSVFSNPGAFTWTAPPGATLARVIAVGGGGGGGGAANNGAGGGGGGGGYVEGVIPVVAGQTYSGLVGGGGSRGLSNGQASTAGGTSSFTAGASTLSATGGGGGTFGNGTNVGITGAGGNGVGGDIAFAGSIGQNGIYVPTGTANSVLFGGMGGGSRFAPTTPFPYGGGNVNGSGPGGAGSGGAGVGDGGAGFPGIVIIMA